VDPHRPALRNHSCLTDLAQRICAVAHFLIDILQFKSAIASAPGTGTHSILGVPLDYTVGNSQRVATLPINSVAPTLDGNVQMFQPAHGGRCSEGSGRIDHRVAHAGIALHAAPAQTRIQPIQQKRLIIVHLNVAAKGSARQRNPCGDIEQSRFCAFTSINGFWPFFTVGRPRGVIKVTS
jgi:hypothetical protein